MRILLTNDDGISSPGIFLLAAGLRETGHRVFTVAPAANQSGVSHSISFLNGPCKLTDVDTDTWFCEGTPVDCIITGLLGGIPELCILRTAGSDSVESAPPDMVISGINRGANLGTDIIYSGTAAAARQGSLFSIPSLALSLVEGMEWNWDMAVIFVVEQLTAMLSYWKPDSFVNVNIPNRRELPSSLVHAFPSLRYYNDSMDRYHAPDGNIYCFARTGEVSSSRRTGAFIGAGASSGNDTQPEQGSDWEAVAENNAAISEIFIHPVLLDFVRGRGDA